MENINQEEMIAETPVVEQPQEEAPKTTFLTGTPLGGTAVEGVLQKASPVVDKAVSAAKKIDKKIWIIAGAAIAALIAVLIIFGAGNTYKTPLDEAVKIANLKESKDPVDDALGLLNGFGEKELKNCVKILKNAEQYEDVIDMASDAVEGFSGLMEEEYGEGYKFSYKVTDKEKLEKSDLRKVRSDIRDTGKQLEDALEEVDISSEMYDAIEETTGLKKSDVKDILEELEALAKLLKDANVTDGYELEVTFYVDSKESDKEDLEEYDIEVYKINGRWVSVDAVRYLLAAITDGVDMSEMEIDTSIVEDITSEFYSAAYGDYEDYDY